VINESTNNPVIWDDIESNIKIVKEQRNIPKLTAKEFIWHKDAWWDREMYGEE